MDLGIVNHANLGPESGNFRAIHRPEVPQIEGGMLLSTDGSTRVEGRAVAGLIIFSDVAPGEYNLARVQTTWRAGNMI